MSLHALQAAVWHAVRARRAPTTLRDTFVGDAEMSVVRRMQIYRSAYWARHEKCLKETYPCVLKQLGAHAFRTAAASYIEHHPSRVPYIERAGHAFAAHLSTHPPTGHDGDVLGDLAALEWARVEVAMAPDSSSRFDVRALSEPGAFDRRLVIAACVRLLRVKAAALALLHGEPDAPREQVKAAEHAARYVVVFRSARVSREQCLDDAQGRALWRAVRGEPLAAVCAELGDEGDLQSTSVVLARWIGSGLVTGLEATDGKG